MTSADIKKLLAEKYCAPSYAFFSELRLGTGYGADANGYIDGYVIYLWGELERTAFEIKISRSDFLSEVKKPSKRRQAMAFSNKFYFVAPAGLLKPEEIPCDSGLMEVTESNELKIKVKAPVRESIRPTWRFFAALARRVAL